MTTSSPKARADAAMRKARKQIEDLYKVAKPVRGKDDHNPLAMMGQGVTDEDYIEEFALPPEVARTPEINDAMLQRVWEENYNYYDTEA